MTEEAPLATILIVEDEALIARKIQHRLTHIGWDVIGWDVIGWEVVSTAFCEEAVALAVETQPDLLHSNINLRNDLSRIGLAQRIQAVMDIPVIILAACSDEDAFARVKKVTPFDYNNKPVADRDQQISIEMPLRIADSRQWLWPPG